MKKGKTGLSIIMVFCFLLTGCASIISKSQYPVTINSFPDDATIVIKDENSKQIYKGKTPTTVTLVSGESYFHGKSYAVEFSKPGYETQTAYVKSSMDGWYIGNLLFGGLIGFLIVDPMTGAMYKLPQDLTISLVETTGAYRNSEKTLQVVSINQINPDLRRQLIRIK